MSKTIPIQKPLPMTAEQRRSLRALLAIMIPASAEYDVPGADDDLIVADILASLTPKIEPVAETLAWLDERAGSGFADLDGQRQAAIAQSLLESPTPAAVVLTTLVLQCYYRDDRVMRSLNMEPRPPFPKGFELEQGDWALLDPVRARPKIYREAP